MAGEVEARLTADLDRERRRRRALDPEETGRLDDDVAQASLDRAMAQVRLRQRAAADVAVADEEDPHRWFFSQMRRSPSRVRSGSTPARNASSFSKTGASPPVAMTGASTPSSA